MGNGNVFEGCIPALMTPCDEKGVPNLDALVAKGRQLINTGMKSVVYCGSMGDWPLLTDEQRQEGVSALIDSGIPVIINCFPFATSASRSGTPFASHGVIKAGMHPLKTLS